MTTIWDDDTAIALAIDMECRGFRFTVRDGRLVIAPADRLTETELALCREQREPLMALALMFEDGVVDRAEGFRRDRAPGQRCDDCDRPGPRCWRCRLAHRLISPSRETLTIEEVFRLAAPMLERRNEVA